MGVPDTEDDHKNLTVQYGWQHCLTVARELSLKNGKLYQKPHRSLEKLREKKIFEKSCSYDSFSDNLISKDINSYEVLIDNIKNSENFELLISEGVSIKYKNNRFILEFINDIGKKIGGGRYKRSCDLEKLENLRILIDTSAIEIFVNDGEIVFATRYYPDEYSFEIIGNMNLTIYKLSNFNINH